MAKMAEGKGYPVTDKELAFAKEKHKTVHGTGIDKHLSDYDRGRIDGLITILSLIKHRGHWIKAEDITTDYLGWIAHHAHTSRIRDEAIPPKKR